MREWVGTQLHPVNLGPCRRASLVVEDGARACRGPEFSSFPAGIGIVDAPIDVLAEKTHRIGNMDRYELPIDQCQERLAAIGFRYRDVRAESQRVISIDPHEIRVIGAAGFFDILELRPRKWI